MMDHTENIQSLSDDDEEEDIRPQMTRLIGKDRVRNINENGFCWLDGKAHAIGRVQLLISGWVRNVSRGTIAFRTKVLEFIIRHRWYDIADHHDIIVCGTRVTPPSRRTPSLPVELHDIIVRFYGLGFDPNRLVCLQSKEQNPGYFLVLRKFIVLSPLLEKTTNHTVQLNQVDAGTLNLVLQWMCHHKGIAPAPIPKPISSRVMRHMTPDIWDAQFIDSMDKKLIFRLLNAANFLGIESLSM